MPDLANVAETPVLVRSSHIFGPLAYRLETKLFACIDVIEALWPFVNKAEYISLRFSSEPSKGSRAILFLFTPKVHHHDSAVHYQDEDGGYAYCYARLGQFLLDEHLLAAEPGFTRTLHVSVHVHEET